jgi:hypothetical protein
MWPSPEFQWLISAFALAVFGAAWMLSAMLSNNLLARMGNIVGGFGAGVAAIGIATALNPVPGITAKEILAIWLASLGMIIVGIIIGIVMASQSPSPLRWVFVACGVVCLLLNVWAIALLLWIATVSPGGV